MQMFPVAIGQTWLYCQVWKPWLASVQVLVQVDSALTRCLPARQPHAVQNDRMTDYPQK